MRSREHISRLFSCSYSIVGSGAVCNVVREKSKFLNPVQYVYVLVVVIVRRVSEYINLGQ